MIERCVTNFLGSEDRLTRCLLALLMLVFAVDVVGQGAWENELDTAPSLEVQPMQELECLVKPDAYVELSSPVDSIIEEIKVETGDTVKKGQVIAMLESSVEKAKIRLAEVQADSQVEIQIREQQLLHSTRQYKRLVNLLYENLASEADTDKAKTEAALAEIELGNAMEKRDIARLRLELARAQLKLKTIYSPVNGIVVERYAMVGESVSGRTIMKLATIDPLKVEVIAPTEFFGRIKKGMKVNVYPEQPRNQVFEATVTVVDQLIDPASGSFTVRMALPNPDHTLVGGVNCLASFSIDDPAQFKDGKASAVASTN